ncbi:ABC transporter permease [Streptomyces sp. NPDC048172]|uniref:ABC transporter permease n=1 Tax=Streptomyces sp. NPDC048172 TaxID=3365505 RepID=UPI00372395D2
MGIFADVWAWLTTGAHWTDEGGVLERLGEHAYLTVVCLALSCALALPLALWLGHLGKGGALAVNLSNAGRAIPTFAVLVLLSMGPLGRHGDWATIVALVLFALPPLLTNAYTGVREADREVVEAARGMGMTHWQLLRQVELPLAVPLIMTGVQTAAVQLVATATLAALPGGGGLGRLITAGFGNRDTPQVVSGAVLVALLALLVERLLTLTEKLLDPMRRRHRTDAAAPAAPGLKVS